VVVGWAYDGYEAHAVIWTNGVIQDIDGLGGGTSDAWSVSADGEVVVGWAVDSSDFLRAFRWENGVMEDIGDLGGFTSHAFGVSADGSVIAGGSQDDSLDGYAFRWENWLMQNLGTLGGEGSEALGISADGIVVVGWSIIDDSTNVRSAFRWENDFMDDLGTLGGLESMAFATSSNGSVIVGWADDFNDEYRAFRWENGAMEDLGTLGGENSIAYGVSGDGSVVVGFSYDPNWYKIAFCWEEFDGMEDLNLLYDTLLTPGSELEVAYGISENGRFIVGSGYNAVSGRNEGFLLDTENSTGIDDNSSANPPDEFTLEQNYPNPFNPSTKIRFTIPASSLNPFSKGEGTYVTLKVFDVLGNEVATLVDEYKPAGSYEVEFNPASGIRNPASGVYFYQLIAGKFIQSRKMLLLK